MHLALALTLWFSAAPSTAARQAATARSEPAVDQPTAGYYFLLGRYLEGEGKVAEAADALKQAIQLEPKSAEPRAELAALYARQDRATDAVAAAEDALKVDPDNREANRVLGSVLAALTDRRLPGRTEAQVAQDQTRAIKALEIARGNTAGDLSLDLTLAKLYLARNRPGDAVPLLRRIVDEQPQYLDGSLLLATALEAAGQEDEAADTLNELLSDQPTMFRGRVQLAELYERQRRWPQAADAWAQVQKLNPRDSRASSRRASALLNAGRANEARDVLTEALKAQPGDPGLSYMLAQVQREQGDLDAAEATARQLRSRDPEDIRGLYALAQVLEARGRHQEVVDLLTPEIARMRTTKNQAGQLAMLLDTQALSYQQLRRNDEAIAAFKEAVQRAPDEPVRHVLLIQGLIAANRGADAIAAAEAARRAFPEDTSVMYQLGAALDKSGRRAEAEKTFRDIIARDPLDANALNYLGYMFAEQGTQLDEAVVLIERALKVEPDNASFLDSLGWAYVQQGKLDLADRPLSAAAGKMPRNSVIQEHLGDLRMKQNRRDEAIAAWQRALTGDGESIDRARIQKKIDAARQGKK